MSDKKQTASASSVPTLPPTSNLPSPIPDALHLVQEFQAASLHLSTFVDQIPLLQKQFIEKNDQVTLLRAQIEKVKEEENTARHKQLHTYREAYEQFKNDKAALQERIEKLQNSLRDKEAQNAGLGDQIKRINASNAGLQAQLKEASEKLQKSQKENIKLNGLWKSAEEMRKKRSGQLDAAARELQELKSFSLPMRSTDPERIGGRVQSLWHFGISTVRKYFEKDISITALRDGWDRTHENKVFEHQIPLPNSNSPIAKEMRIAVILGTLARLVDRWIFEPTYSMPETAALRDLLSRQAEVEPKKETFLRSMISSVFQEEQEIIAAERIKDIKESLLQVAGMQQLLNPASTANFQKDIEVFLFKSRELWHDIQLSESRFEAVFEYLSTDTPWHTLELKLVDGRNGKVSVSPTTTSELEEDLFVIFPRFYLVQEKPQIISEGIVLYRGQCKTASKELRDERTSGLFGGPGRHTIRTSRAMSFGVDRNGNTSGNTGRNGV